MQAMKPHDPHGRRELKSRLIQDHTMMIHFGIYDFAAAREKQRTNPMTFAIFLT